MSRLGGVDALIPGCVYRPAMLALENIPRKLVRGMLPVDAVVEVGEAGSWLPRYRHNRHGIRGIKRVEDNDGCMGRYLVSWAAMRTIPVRGVLGWCVWVV